MTKICNSCSEAKQEEDFYKNEERADGLFSICKKCCSNKQAKRTKANIEKWSTSDPYKSHETGYKKCRACNHVLSVLCFGISKDRADGLHPLCKECKRADNVKWKQDNTEATKKYSELYRTVNADKLSRKQSQYREKYPDRYKAMNAVNNAILLGKLVRATDSYCANPECGNKAKEYHHNSYDPEHWLDVIPLCASCHRKVGFGTLVMKGAFSSSKRGEGSVGECSPAGA